MTQYNQISGMKPINQKRGFRIHLLIFLLAVPALWLTWYLTDTTYLWPLWQTGGWAIGILFHYLGVFAFKKSGTSQSQNN